VSARYFVMRARTTGKALQSAEVCVVGEGEEEQRPAADHKCCQKRDDYGQLPFLLPMAILRPYPWSARCINGLELRDANARLVVALP
jgi:hypothetical protein